MTTQHDVPASTSVPAARLIGDRVRHWATVRPDAPAIRYEGQAFTWSQWVQRIGQATGALKAAGIGRRDVVAFLDKNNLACLEVTQAAAALGAATAIVNWRLAPEEVAYILADCRPRIVFVGTDLLPVLDQVRDGLQGLEQVIVAGGDADGYETWLAHAPAMDPDPAVEPDDPAIVLYTSGTTGFPKGALLTHRGLVAHTEANLSEFAMVDGDHSLVAMPLFHVGGSSYALIGFHAGLPSTLLREVSGPGLIRAVLAGASHAFLVPAVIAALVEAGPAALGPMSGLKVLAYGASPCPLPVLRAAMAGMPGTEFMQVYGMTELSGVVTVLSRAAHRDQAHTERLTSAGQPIAGVELRVVDPATGGDVPAGQTGELWWRTQQRMAGYLGKPEATQEAITPDGWLRSGDVGRVDDGGFVFIEDRVKDMIITGGENVYSPEVERVLVEHPSVADVAVVGVPDERWGELVMAFVQPAPGATVDPDELIGFARLHLAAFKCPRQVEVVEALPRNGTGKVRKGVLRRPYWEGTGRKV